MFYDAIVDVFKGLPEHRFIITYVDDGSRDDTLNEIKKVAATAEKGTVQYISLSRNFGKESAVYAGLSKSRGIMWHLWMWICSIRPNCLSR